MPDKTEWISAIRDLASRAGCLETIRPLLERLERDTDCVTLAIAGAPNSGKSTLLNSLFERPLIAIGPVPCTVEVQISATKEPVTGAARPPQEVPASISDATSDLQLAIDSSWLRKQRLHIIERRGLDVTEEDMESAIDASLEGTDILLLVVDSTMPMRRAEPLLLHEADRRGLPILVVIHKRDALLNNDDRQSVRAYVQRYAALAAPHAAVLELPAEDTRAALQKAIDKAIDDLDVGQTRGQSTLHTLRRLARSVTAAAEAGRAASNASREEVDAEIARRRRELDLEKLAWTGLEFDLEQRRQRTENEVRLQVTAQRSALIKVLGHELHRSTDVRSWWDDELPVLMQRELRHTGLVVADHVRRALVGDFQWLHEQLRARTGFSAQPLPEPDPGPLDASELQQPKLGLSDTNKLRLLLGAGASVALVIAGRYFDRARVPFVSLAVAILGVPAASRVLNRATTRDREQVRKQLEHLIAQSEADYIRSVSSKVKAAYAEALQALRGRRDEWLKAQLDSVTNAADTGALPVNDWDAIVQESTAFANRLEGATP